MSVECGKRKREKKKQKMVSFLNGRSYSEGEVLRGAKAKGECRRAENRFYGRDWEGKKLGFFSSCAAATRTRRVKEGGGE